MMMMMEVTLMAVMVTQVMVAMGTLAMVVTQTLVMMMMMTIVLTWMMSLISVVEVIVSEGQRRMKHACSAYQNVLVSLMILRYTYYYTKSLDFSTQNYHPKTSITFPKNN